MFSSVRKDLLPIHTTVFPAKRVAIAVILGELAFNGLKLHPQALVLLIV